MPKIRSQLVVHPSLFDPIVKPPQWNDLPQEIRRRITPLLIQLLRRAVQKLARVQKGGDDE
jgi:hypothetical protein